jgi:hypothetical protein
MINMMVTEQFVDLIWTPDDVLAKLDARQAQLQVKKQEDLWSVARLLDIRWNYGSG